jgi:nucleoside-diphosphate-sugar epimerase
MRNAARSDWVGVANIGGGLQTSMNDVIAHLSEICGPVQVVRRVASAGDVRHTGADTRVAANAFGYRARTALPEGLQAMVRWEHAKEPALA